MRLLPKSIHRCHRYPTKFNSGRDIPLLRWYRELIAAKYDGSQRRGPGRPRVMETIRELVRAHEGEGKLKLGI